MDLTWCFPHPVPVQVAGRVLYAAPLRLRDLAKLQAYLAVSRPSPLDVARPAIMATEEGSEARRRLLRDTFKASLAWPVRLGSTEAGELFATPDGLRFWLSVMVGECNPGLTADDLAEVASRITVPEYVRLSKVCHGAAPMEELKRLIAPDCFDGDDDPKPFNWGKMLAEIVELTGWTFAELGELTVTQLAAFRSKGDAGGTKLDPPKGMGRYAFARRQRQFFGPDRDEEV